MSNGSCHRLLQLVGSAALLAAPACGQNASDGFDPNADNRVEAIAVQSDGRILIGGIFSTVGGTNLGGLARLNVDGTVDSTFQPPPGTGAFSPVYALAVQDDAKILVGGSFNALLGQLQTHLGRLNPDGSLDSGFKPTLSGSLSTGVFSLAVQSDGKILVGGGFTNLAGRTRNSIGRLYADGGADATLNPGATGAILDAAPGALSLTSQPDGKILVGGHLTTLGGQSRTNVGRLNPDGSVDSTFDCAADGFVRNIVVQRDGKILVGGSFTSLAGQPRHFIGRINSDGSVEAAFDPGATNAGNPLAIGVSSIVLEEDAPARPAGNTTAQPG